MEKKKFNLKLALLGHPLVTRDGHCALITGLTASYEYPLIGVVLQGGSLLKHTWTLDGKWDVSIDETHNDLFMG